MSPALKQMQCKLTRVGYLCSFLSARAANEDLSLIMAMSREGQKSERPGCRRGRGRWAREVR